MSSVADLPVLMVTAEARKEDIVLAAQTGADSYIDDQRIRSQSATRRR